MNLLDAIVPPSALMWEASRRDRIDRVLFECVAIVQPPPFAMRWDNGEIIDPFFGSDDLTDDELDEMTVIHRDPIDFDVVRDLLRWADEGHDKWRRVPHPLSWRRWEISRFLVRRLLHRWVSISYVGDWSGSYLSVRRRTRRP